MFVDSAPVLENALARNAGLGWIGKHTCLIDKRRRLVVLPRRDLHRPAAAGRCARERALRHLHALHRHLPDAGDHRALPARCAPLHLATSPSSTQGSDPEELRPLIGNRIFGCDDCQLVCPWNKFAHAPRRAGFPRAQRVSTRATLVDLFAWSEEEFLQRTEGSAIRRTGYDGWLRNIAVALGNAPTTPDVLAALESRAFDDPSDSCANTWTWALARHEEK